LGILSKVVQVIAKKHAGKFATNVNRQFDPQLYNAVMNKLDKKLSVFCSTFDNTLNPEMEVMQDVLFDGLKIGYLDDIIDMVKYGRYALNGAKFKISEYLIAYRDALTRNLPALKGRGFVFDMRKGDVSEAEVNEVMKKIFLS
jgi:hypothetical protein